MDERLFSEVNQLARATPWLHAALRGYATYGMALFAGLLLAGRRLGLVAVTAAALMGFARVYTAAHYPHDVAAGPSLPATSCGAGPATDGRHPDSRRTVSSRLHVRSLPSGR